MKPKYIASIGIFLTVTGSFVAAINLASMFPNPEYAASWSKVFFSTAIVVLGRIVIYESNNKFNIDKH